MASRWAVATGNWSNTSTWNGGTLPTAEDTVRPNGFTVTIDQNVTVAQLRNDASSPAVGGGLFVLSAGLTLTANIVGSTGGSNNGCVNVSYTTGTATIVGNISCPGPSQFISGVLFNGSGTLNIIGNIEGGGVNEQVGIRTTSTGILNITGNVTSYGSQSGADGMRITSSGLVNITGIVSNSGAAYAINNSGGGFLTVTGTISSTSSTSAVFSSLSTRLTLNGTLTGSGSSITVMMGNATFIHNGNIVSPSNGRCLHQVSTYLIDPSAIMQYEFRVNNAGVAGVARSLFTGGQNLGQPTVSNVRQGTTFGISNEFTGTLIVPSAQYVALGTPVGSGVGTLQYLTMSDLQSALQPNGPIVVERSKEDTNGITFSWPVSGATITGQVSKNNGAYSATAGTVSFLRTDGSRHYYILSYNASDRPVAEGTARYRLTDGTYTKYFTLRVEPSYVANVNVTPGLVFQQDPATKQDLLIYTDEEDNFTVDIFRQDGITPVNLSGMTLQFRVSDLNDTLLYTINSGSITVGGPDNNQITFSKSSLTSNDFEGKWGLRDTANGDKVIAYGRIEILYVP